MEYIMEKNKQYIIDDKDLMEEWDYENNDKLNIFPNDITIGSHKKVFRKCKKCGYLWQAVVKCRTRKDGKAIGCPECGKRTLSKIHATPIAGVNDLESQFPDIAREWHPTKNGDLKPSQVLKKSGYRVWWKCSLCGNEFQRVIRDKVESGVGCRLCSVKRTGEINVKPLDSKLLQKTFID
ncbi:MAG: hypothetical protein E7313_05875 [Clostridiales bacterium]|nr:hypothetical protein [Clostridiales bacterium]